uniref:fibropellin-1-like n=1 Tax=Styela clava TaxID=7725 RepID=UPI00193A1566|nr:fibropellin-1-like [Styela clava]
MGIGLIISIALVTSVQGQSVFNADACDSSPCKHGGTCELSTKEPYYTCVCHQEYQGTQCEERKFINSITNNCKYHVNHRDKKTFAETNSTCSSLGGAIAMMKTARIQDLVESQVIKQYGGSGYPIGFWIGGYKDNNRWIWVDDTDVPMTGGFQKWSVESDHTSITKRSMILSSFYRSRTNMGWFARKNSGKNGYICEISVVDRCLLFPCQNLGTCTPIGCQRKCECMWGYTGENCENRISQISCLQSGISIQWNRENHKMGRVYKLHLEDLMSKSSKATNVQILVTDEASINIGNVSEPTPIHCVSSTRLSISPNKYILVDLWVARIRMSLKSVAKVYYIFDESKFKVELADLS